MVLGVRAGEQVVGNASLAEQIEETIMIYLVDFFDRFALLICRNHDRRTVCIRAGNHQNVVAFQTMITGHNITGQVRAGYIANVDLSIGIRPRNCDQDVFGHT